MKHKRCSCDVGVCGGKAAGGEHKITENLLYTVVVSYIYIYSGGSGALIELGKRMTMKVQKLKRF